MMSTPTLPIEAADAPELPTKSTLILPIEAADAPEITLRQERASQLTYSDVDANFTALQNTVVDLQQKLAEVQTFTKIAQQRIDFVDLGGYWEQVSDPALWDFSTEAQEYYDESGDSEGSIDTAPRYTRSSIVDVKDGLHTIQFNSSESLKTAWYAAFRLGVVNTAPVTLYLSIEEGAAPYIQVNDYQSSFSLFVIRTMTDHRQVDNPYTQLLLKCQEEFTVQSVEASWSYKYI